MPEEDKQDLDKSGSHINMVIIIDKDKLPEELRDKFPQDLQNRLIELLQEDAEQSPLQNQNQSRKDEKFGQPEQFEQPKQSKQFKQSNLFSVQQGAVIGNIYKDKSLQDQLTKQK